MTGTAENETGMMDDDRFEPWDETRTAQTCEWTERTGAIEASPVSDTRANKRTPEPTVT